jgi:hypothetical protein
VGGKTAAAMTRMINAAIRTRLRREPDRQQRTASVSTAPGLGLSQPSLRLRSADPLYPAPSAADPSLPPAHFALNGTDHRSHAEQNAVIAGYVRWHNIRAQPKVNFATDSPIRTWTDYPAKAA